MTGYTAGGLPYPTMDDKLNETGKQIRDLATAVKGRLATPGLILTVMDVVTDSGGVGWFNFPQLSRLDGIIPQVLVKGAGLYWIIPLILSRNGNAAAVKFRSAQMNTRTGQAGQLANYVGILTCTVYAWGVPA